VIFGDGKTAEQIVEIATRMIAQGHNVLVTRIGTERAAPVAAALPQARHHPDARVLTVTVTPVAPLGRGTILVISAGTSDLPVAEEAVVTAAFLGNRVERLYDVGVAGLHRLPSVVGGLVDRPVIAVPTSVGYGASLGGLAALLGMLNSCAAGVTVVNVDNGFGAAAAASLINRA
jgi:hypothetical protein